MQCEASSAKLGAPSLAKVRSQDDIVRRKRYPPRFAFGPDLKRGEVFSSVVVRTSLGIAASRTAGCEKHKWDPQLYSSAEVHCDELMASQLMAWIDATHFTSSRATASTSTHNFALASKTLALASKNLLDGASTALFDVANTARHKGGCRWRPHGVNFLVQEPRWL
jgi:hypothetical protein